MGCAGNVAAGIHTCIYIDTQSSRLLHTAHRPEELRQTGSQQARQVGVEVGLFLSGPPQPRIARRRKDDPIFGGEAERESPSSGSGWPHFATRRREGRDRGGNRVLVVAGSGMGEGGSG